MMAGISEFIRVMAPSINGLFIFGIHVIIECELVKVDPMILLDNFQFLISA